ncbi:MAG: hypothetical protein NTU73_10095, partial [Ignavibacteriae bacterium]|nr:hypothetical protein [Ignavibacteriota bacterium]
NKPLPKKRGRPRKIKEEIPKIEIPEIKEEIKPVLENEEVPEDKKVEIQETIEKTIPETEIPLKSNELILTEDISEPTGKKETIEKEQVEDIYEEQTIGIVPAPEEEKTEDVKIDLPEKKIKRKSNYQISLVDENHLRARVLTNKLISIYCSVKDKYSYADADSSGERHTNKIFVHPKENPQEVEIMVSIGLSPIPEEKKEEVKENFITEKNEKDSNYQVSLVDENLLRVMIITEKSVSVDCSIKDEDTHTDGSSETQANKIFIHPKDKPQEVEIIVSIGSVALSTDTDIPVKAEENTDTPASKKGKLTPNPIVANLIQKFSDSPVVEDNGIPKTPEEKLEEMLGPKNPWRLYKELMHRNLIVGLIGAVLIYIIFVVSFYSVASKKNNNADVIEAPRLIVMQDLPENQFLQQNVEDPNKPPEEEKPNTDDAINTNKIPPIVPKKIKPPRIIGPPRQKIDTTSSAIDKELDSLRKVNKDITSNGKTPGDTNKRITGNFPIPDSIMRGLKDNEVGLIGRFPPNWKQIDSREVDINKKEFTGVILVDTAVKKKEEALNMSVQLDKNNEYWKQFNFKNVFSEDSLKNIIYNIEPKQEGDQTYYRFYISGMAYNIYIAAFINNEHFEKHKAEIEQVVRTIRIQKPATPPGK